MTWNFDDIKSEISAAEISLNTSVDVENFRIKYLGRKGLISEIYSSLGKLPQEERPSVGKSANELKQLVSQIVEEKKKEIACQAQSQNKVSLDPTLPGICPEIGSRHILSQTIEEICQIFERMGFDIFEGPEVETEFNNFSALNIPIDHPSRDAFDTFFLDTINPEQKDRNLLLRSHTSPGQVRVMKEIKPPLAVVVPGKVYRPDAVDASHSFMFHQIEGLLVDKKITFSELKGILQLFCQTFFGKDIKMRFRPHFFPFTEPSAEVDISCYICGQKGCSVCGRKGWLEIMGCGMVHPRVFEAVDYPKNKYTGLAFGMGVERMAMLRYGLNDIRIFFENDVRFLRQF